MIKYKQTIILILLSIVLISCSILYKSDGLEPVELVSVVDGDTIKVIYNNEKVNLRLAEIDCYETGMNSRTKKQLARTDLTLDQIKTKGNESKQYLIDLITNKEIKIKVIKKGYYNRPIVDVYIITDKENINVNDEMLSKGGCEIYKR